MHPSELLTDGVWLLAHAAAAHPRSVRAAACSPRARARAGPSRARRWAFLVFWCCFAGVSAGAPQRAHQAMQHAKKTVGRLAQRARGSSVRGEARSVE